MKMIVMAALAALLTGAPALAHPASSNTLVVTGTDPISGQRFFRPATPAESAAAHETIRDIQPSLAGLEASLAPLKHLDKTLAPLAGLGASLAGLKDIGPKIDRLQRMVATETPVSTTRTSEGLVRVYRDGTTVTDFGGNRTFQMKD